MSFGLAKQFRVNAAAPDLVLRRGLYKAMGIKKARRTGGPKAKRIASAAYGGNAGFACACEMGSIKGAAEQILALVARAIFARTSLLALVRKVLRTSALRKCYLKVALLKCSAQVCCAHCSAQCASCSVEVFFEGCSAQWLCKRSHSTLLLCARCSAQVLRASALCVLCKLLCITRLSSVLTQGSFTRVCLVQVCSLELARASVPVRVRLRFGRKSPFFVQLLLPAIA